MRRSDFRYGMMIWYTLQTECDDRIVEKSSAGVWMEWSLFDVHMCWFEMDQCLNACFIDLAAYCPRFRLAPTFKQDKLQRTTVVKTNRKQT